MSILDVKIVNGYWWCKIFIHGDLILILVGVLKNNYLSITRFFLNYVEVGNFLVSTRIIHS